VTWNDRQFTNIGTGANPTLWDTGYNTTVQNASGTICVFFYYPTTSIDFVNVSRAIMTEDYVVNHGNVYTDCESFTASWTAHGANATISNAQFHNGANSIKLDNTVATGGINDYAILQTWSGNAAVQTTKVALSAWRYMAVNTANNGLRILDSSMVYNVGIPRIQVAVLGSAANHLKWYNGTAYQDTLVVVPNTQWGKITLRFNMGPSSTTGEILYNNVSATTSLGQAASGLLPYSAEFQGASLGSTQNVIDYVDDVYTHQYTANVPVVTTAAEQLNLVGSFMPIGGGLVGGDLISGGLIA
jgi:hypothetical protein